MSAVSPSDRPFYEYLRLRNDRPFQNSDHPFSRFLRLVTLIVEGLFSGCVVINWQQCLNLIQIFVVFLVAVMFTDVIFHQNGIFHRVKKLFVLCCCYF
jgi:hypothetical protein